MFYFTPYNLHLHRIRGLAQGVYKSATRSLICPKNTSRKLLLCQFSFVNIELIRALVERMSVKRFPSSLAALIKTNLQRVLVSSRIQGPPN